MITIERNEYGGRLKYFLTPATEDFWDSFWDTLAPSIDYRRAESGHLPLQLRRTFLKWTAPGARVLEAGCGFGQFTVAAHALGYKAEGVDYAPRIVDFIQHRFPHIRFFQGDVRNLTTIPDDSYDAVYSPGVCEHYEDGPDAVLAEAARILAPGGLLFVSTPLFCGMRRALARVGLFRDEPKGEFFQYAFTDLEMTRALQRFGFSVVDSFGSGGLKTITDHIPLMSRLVRGRLERPIGGAITALPIIGQWTAHSCIWVAQLSPRSVDATDRHDQ